MSDVVNCIGDLVIEVPGVDPQTRVLQVGDLFLESTYEPLLSLPLVSDGKVVGIISRYSMMQVLFRPFGRDLYARQPIERLMSTTPVVVDAALELSEAAERILNSISFPVTEDFIIVRDGRYYGMGVVMRLIQALQRQLAARSRELARALEELKHSETQLIQSEKMASLGQMVAGVAHEINTPLGYVRNNMDMLQGFFQESSQVSQAALNLTDVMLADTMDEALFNQRLAEMVAFKEQMSFAEFADDMERLFADTRFGVDQISKLVTGMKNFSRLDRDIVEEVDLHECLDSALMLANNVLKHKAKVYKQYGDIPRVACAPSEVNQVLLNMLTNAAQAMDEPGRILLRTEADEQSVRILIQDTGKGIPREVRARIFDPFFTTKKVGEGTGLGLSISYKIIQQHGGNIQVISQVGKGTRFTITLPRRSPVAVAHDNEDAVSA
ncbi:MAG: ATP-binding protein [Alcanivorax sp.]|nr:ATP-binding protein [Alcanivorax sp.]